MLRGWWCMKYFCLCLLLAAVAIVVFGWSKPPRDPKVLDPRSVTINNGREMMGLCKRFERQFGVWPTNPLQVFSNLGMPVSNVIFDGWGRPFVLRTNFGPRLVIVSYGRDGKPGGLGEDADGTFEY